MCFVSGDANALARSSSLPRTLTRARDAVGREKIASDSSRSRGCESIAIDPSSIPSTPLCGVDMLSAVALASKPCRLPSSQAHKLYQPLSVVSRIAGEAHQINARELDQPAMPQEVRLQVVQRLADEHVKTSLNYIGRQMIGTALINVRPAAC